MDLPLNPETPEPTSTPDPKPRPTGTRLVLKVGFQAVLVLLFLIAAALGTVSGVLFAYAGDLPKISALDDYAPSTISRVYGAGGEVVGEFAIQRREVIPYEAISPKLRQAILAAEDDEFERHVGLSIPRIAVMIIRETLMPKWRSNPESSVAMIACRRTGAMSS